jgi:membrane-associated phospholipid phosphatase
VIMAWRLGLHRIASVLTVFLGGTIVATVYLGWHFFVVDLAGLAIAAASVLVGLRIVPLRAARSVRGRSPRPADRSAAAVPPARDGVAS